MQNIESSDPGALIGKRDEPFAGLAAPRIPEATVAPLYRGDGHDLLLFGQKQFAVVRGSDAVHLLGTCGLGACVAVVAYCKEHQLVFGTHFDICTDSAASARELWRHVRLVVPRGELLFRGHVVGGRDDWSEDLVSFCKELDAPKGIRLELVAEDILGRCTNVGRSVAMDGQDGQVVRFDPIGDTEHSAIFFRSTLARSLGGNGTRVASCVHLPDGCHPPH